MNEFDMFFEKILDHFEVVTIKELSEKIDTGQSTISNWKQRKSIKSLKKKCRELGIYNEIFGDINSNVSNFQNSTNVVGQDFSNNSKARHSQNIGNKNDIDENVLKLVDTLYSYAKSKNKIAELQKDLSSLLTKYL